MKPNTSEALVPEASLLSAEMVKQLSAFLGPFLVQLDARVDVRLVRTFAATIVNLVRQRERTLSLILSELGEMLTTGPQAPAGVKRLWRLLHSTNWHSGLVDTWLIDQANDALERARERDGVALAVLDDSVVEKPAARRWVGLTKVRSAQASRLQRACGGAPPPRPTVVPGFGWVAVVVTGLTGSLSLARLHWYSPNAPEVAKRQGEAQRATVLPFLLLWADRVLWLVDRGFANSPFLGEALARVRFVARWRKDYQLRLRPSGELAKASALSQRQRSRWTRQVRDPVSRQAWTMGLVSLPVTLPEDERPLWLVVARRKGQKHGKPRSETFWLLTTEEAGDELGAGFVLQAYARRWQVEWALRFEKSDLGIQSVRVESWLYRQKLWRLAELVHAFLLSLLVLLSPEALARLLHWCHRTGRRARQAIAPIYRLHHALANLWNESPPTLAWSP